MTNEDEFTPGDLVVILSGPFAEFVGVFESSVGMDAKVAVSVFGRRTHVDVRLSDLAPAPPSSAEPVFDKPKPSEDPIAEPQVSAERGWTLMAAPAMVDLYQAAEGAIAAIDAYLAWHQTIDTGTDHPTSDILRYLDPLHSLTTLVSQEAMALYTADDPGLPGRSRDFARTLVSAINMAVVNGYVSIVLLWSPDLKIANGALLSIRSSSNMWRAADEALRAALDGRRLSKRQQRKWTRWMSVMIHATEHGLARYKEESFRLQTDFGYSEG
jgi:hypothetical protein